MEGLLAAWMPLCNLYHKTLPCICKIYIAHCLIVLSMIASRPKGKQSASHGQICSDHCVCCHTGMELNIITIITTTMIIIIIITGMPIFCYFPFFPLFLAQSILYFLLFHLSLSELSVSFCVHFL